MATTAKTARKTAAKPAGKPRASAKPRTAQEPAARTKKPDAATFLSIGAAVLAAGVAVAGFLARRQIAAWAAPGSAEHAAPDLKLDAPRPDATTRAPVDFRPDMDAPISPAEREALRPATGPAPSLVAQAGTMNSQTGATN